MRKMTERSEELTLKLHMMFSMTFMILTEQEDGFVKVVELDEGREGQDHDDPDVNQVLRGVFVVEVWKGGKMDEICNPLLFQSFPN